MSPSKTIYHLGSFLIILVVAILIILLPNYPSLKIDNSVEGFEWTPDSEKDFLVIQNTLHRNKIFDVNMIKNQASQEEVDYFNKNGIWPWSPVTKALYIQAIRSNPYVKISPVAALLETQSIYNETAIRMVLSQQTKEGQFLISGIQVQGENVVDELPSGFGEFAYKSGLMEDRSKDVIRCNADGNGLERVQYTGRDSIFGSHTSLVSPVDYNDLENVVPGFTFINGPCNPCVALNEKPDYSCPFRLTLQDRSPGVSNIWRLLWGI